MKILSRTYLLIVFALLYAPILILVIFSFNEGGSLSAYTGFSFRWYGELFHDQVALQSLKNSFVLALGSSVLSKLIGTFAALGLDRMRSRYLRAAIGSVTNIPMMNPDIVTGVSMMLLFVALGGMLGAGDVLGKWTMLIAHTTFSLPYVILSVLPRFKQFDKTLREAALDLGCTPSQSFFKVELPAIVPGIFSGLVMAFTLSLDDFVISHFISSPDFQTLPLYIYNQTAHNVKYSMYALCTLIIVTILVLLLTVNFAGNIGDRSKRKKEAVK